MAIVITAFSALSFCLKGCCELFNLIEELRDISDDMKSFKDKFKTILVLLSRLRNIRVSLFTSSDEAYVYVVLFEKQIWVELTDLDNKVQKDYNSYLTKAFITEQLRAKKVFKLFGKNPDVLINPLNGLICRLQAKIEELTKGARKLSITNVDEIVESTLEDAMSKQSLCN